MNQTTTETKAWTVPGFTAFIVEAVIVITFTIQWRHHHLTLGWVFALAFILIAAGIFTVQPNDSRVITFFGHYVGSVNRSGLHWTNPLTVRRRISRRVRNFASERLKVNDAAGNPVEIAAVIVWRVVDTAKALFDVDDYASFVGVQAETAIRAVAGMHPYDGSNGQVTLLGNQDIIATDLANQLQERLQIAGVEVLETRLAHLAYAPEIAQSMLRRQQAEAVVAARETIVDGAVGMVQMALENLIRSGIVDLDEERKASMVNNLMVVLASDQALQPVVNAGTIYS